MDPPNDYFLVQTTQLLIVCIHLSVGCYIPQILAVCLRTEAYILPHGNLFVRYCNGYNVLVQGMSASDLRCESLHSSMPETG